MHIPKKFESTVVRIFGAYGKVWLSNLDKIFNACIKKWNLSNCIISKDMSINLICFAYSNVHGDVVLKIEPLHPELFTEIKALSLFNGRFICKCYDSDTELSAMLLERIKPGLNLYSLNNISSRIQVAAELFSKLPIIQNKDLKRSIPFGFVFGFEPELTLIFAKSPLRQYHT